MLLYTCARHRVFTFLFVTGCMGDELSRVRDDTLVEHIYELGRVRLPSIQAFFPNTFAVNPLHFHCKCPKKSKKH